MIDLNTSTNPKSRFISEKQLSKNRWYYIAEAGIEYLISLLITDAFLALLLTSNGVPDSAAGIITELAAFAFSAQLVSVFFRKRKGMKSFITILHLINQVMFVLLYFVPVFNLPSSVKVVLIVVMFLGGQLIANIVSPYKISWFMSFVDDQHRGSFTANKEIVSLAAGTVFSMAMGSISDYYKALGKDDVYFGICAATILVLAILHMLSIILVKDVKDDAAGDKQHVKFSTALKKTFTNKALLALILMDVIWQFGSKISLAYYGVYKNNDLGFSMKYIAFLSILSAVSRIAFSRYFGKLADKYSWKRMLGICFGIAAVSFAVNIFTVPSNGKVMFAIYSCIHAISMAGINSGLMNIIFDYVPTDDRAPALGIRTALGGVSAFVSTFAGAFIVHTVQSRGNVVFGMAVYPQQILSAISTVICIGVVLYMIFVVEKLQK
ncbi:MAG: MFS transporter [Ruminococcaceae bacterium]|nr:MFS transporter [Oscillospiraceae bacterium]